MINITEQRRVELLTQFNSNEELKQCVKSELLRGIYSNGVIKEGEDHKVGLNWALNIAWNDEMTPEQKGQLLMAISEGLRALETAFAKIETYKPVAIKEEVPNKAR